ncbi:MAG: T9SS type A sorting domain-containing protein, partial [Ignavibacteriaceae bacterium]|nr:T9SS type A sorting domain-containing protein [Ignavibacteriaceae bacterium]
QDGWFLDDIGIYTWGVVPVELTSFAASVSGTSAELKWITASETNNRGFEIQRSLNGAEWLTAGYISGAGTTTELTEYRWADNTAPEGTVYYRLLQYDYDGSMRIYGPVTAEIGTITEFSLGQNFPNPFNPVTTIRFALPERTDVSLKVFDAQGSEVAVLARGTREAGRHEVQFDASELPSGVYIYRLEAGTYRETRKLVLIK